MLESSFETSGVHHSSQRRAVVRDQVLTLLHQDPLFNPCTEAMLESVEQLGQGGMGVVMRVRDKRLGRDAALKLIHNHQIDEDSIPRFIREAQVTARLDHPSIPSVFELGTTTNGQHYLLMQVVEGETLDQRIKSYHDQRSSHELHVLLEALAKVCEALSYAHDQGIVHRDIKPENIMIGRFGEVFLMDWGLAHEGVEDPRWLSANEAVGSQESLTMAGSVLGTPGYIPPEQILSGNTKAVGDVFALGSILTQILTGFPAVTGKPLERLQKTATGDIKKPIEIDPKVPAELNSLAAAALAFDPEARLVDADSFKVQLQSYLRGIELTVHDYNQREKIEGLIRRHPVGSLVSSLSLIFLLLVSFVIQQWSSDRARRQLAEGSETRLRETLTLLAEASSASRGRVVESEIIQRVEQILKAANHTPAISLLCANIYEQCAIDSKAKQCLDKALLGAPDHLMLLYERHRLEIKFEAAGFLASSPFLERINKICQESNKDEVFALMSEGRKLHYSKQYSKAVSVFTRLLKLTDRLTEAYVFRALCYEKLADPERAIEDFAQALRLEPKNHLVLKLRGRFHMECKDYKQAFRDFTESIKLFPEDPKSYSNRGATLIELGKLKAAIKDLDKAESIDNKSSLIYTHRALARYKMGDRAGGFQDWKRALELDPKNVTATYNQALGRLYTKDTEAALKGFNRTIELDPEHLGSYQNRSRVLQAMKKPKLALEDLQKVISLAPKRAKGYFALGQFHELQDNKAAAISAYEGGLELESNTPSARLVRERLDRLRR